VYDPKAAEQVELHLLQVIQSMQEDMAHQAGEMAKMKAAYAEEMAKMKATIQANHEAHNEERRLGVRQELDDVIEIVDKFVANIEAVNATVQEAVADIQANNATVQALGTQLENAVEALNVSISVAIDCCVATTAALTRGDSDGDGVSDLDDGCPNDEGLTLFGSGLTDTSQCDRTPSLTPSISAEPSLTASLTPSISAGPSVSLAPTTECQGSITTDPITGSEFLVFLFANSLLLYLII